jgi:hypothetical protein
MFMEEKALLQRIATLETINDQLITEINYLDSIARELGFQEGLKTLKEAAIELLQEEKPNPSNDEEPPLTG